MILYYIHQDVGAHNIFKRLKYSIMHARSAFSGRSDVKIHMDYIRNIGRNPQYDTSSLANKDIVDSFNVKMFDHVNITMNYGWPTNDQKCYIDYATSCKVDDQVIMVHSDIFFSKEITIPKNKFVFWGKESVWIGVPWGFVTENDAEKFFDFCNQSGLAKGKATDYTIFSCSVLHIPHRHLQEFKDKYSPMLDFILSMYKEKYAKEVTCSLAGSICTSIIAQDIMKRDNVSHETWFMKSDNVTRYVAEMESDIAGDLRLFF